MQNLQELSQNNNRILNHNHLNWNCVVKIKIKTTQIMLYNHQILLIKSKMLRNNHLIPITKIKKTNCIIFAKVLLQVL